MSVTFAVGMTVTCRDERFVVVDVDALPGSGDGPLYRLTLRSLEEETRGTEIPVLYPIEDVCPEELPEMSLERPGRLARFRLLHDVFRLGLALPGNILVSSKRSRVLHEPYQYVPVLRALELPRARLLIADDVGLGKTVEAGLILQELNARRRANRVLVVCPAGIMSQWQDELRRKFGFGFKVFDRDGVHEARKQLESGANPWSVESRVIASMDFIKRREGAFRELAATQWDVVVVDEAHHISLSRSTEDVSDRHRLGRWLAEATDALMLLTATPHDGYDESFTSLLGLLEPTLVQPDDSVRYSQYRRHLVRRLKRHIKKADGSLKFLERTPPDAVPVTLTEAEAALHAEVLSQSRDLDDLARRVRRRLDAEAIRLVATTLRKRAASSRYALAETVGQRLANLAERIEEVEIQREHLRALRRGEALTDDALAQLERDAHRSYLSVMRRLGRRLRRAEDEAAALERLQSLLAECQPEPDSKMAALVEHLRRIGRTQPNDKVIVFTEYVDTATEIARTLDAVDECRGRYCVLTGELSRDARHEVLDQFGGADKLYLIATDAAGEGLNLHRHCHRIVHFELPWNPNRLEQRNGRIDRYGQTETPLVGFLYARDTYEGEVLALLIGKIDRQIRRLGSVGDVLGQIQAQRIEEIISRAPTDVRAAIEEAERQMDDELNRSAASPLGQVLGDGSLDEDEMRRAVEAHERGLRHAVDLGDFLRRAVRAAGGQAQGEDVLRITTPRAWLGRSVQPRYERLVPPGPEPPDEEPIDLLLEEGHPLIEASIRWVRSSRFAREDDHRLAYVCSSEVAEPDIVATFLVSLRDGEGTEVECLEAVRVSQGSQVSQDGEADLQALETASEGNVPVDVLVRLFRDWWEAARETAMTEARRRAGVWRQGMIAVRGLTQAQLTDELNTWDRASRSAILGKYARGYEQPTLFGTVDIPPAIKRRLRQHEERVRERREFLENRMRLEQPSIEPLGVLLRVPPSALDASCQGGRP